MNSLFESPDYYRDNGNEINWKNIPLGPVSFGWYNNKLYTLAVGDVDNIYDATHDAMDDQFPELNDKILSREDYTHPGRLWLTSKVISFWTHPDKKELIPLIKDLEKDLNIDILNDNKWRIDIPTKEINRHTGDSIWELVSLDEYTGARKLSKKELAIKHTDTAKEKERKKKINLNLNPNYLKNMGFGSNNPKIKPIAYRQAMYSESLKSKYDNRLIESPDYYIEKSTDEDIEWNRQDLNPVVFGWFKGVLYSMITDEQRGVTHHDLSDSYNLRDEDGDIILRDNYVFAGRIWQKTKVISFWEHPPKKLMTKVLQQLSDKLNLDITTNPEWRIDILTVYNPKVRKDDYDNYLELKDAYLDKSNIEDDEDNWSLIPVTDYVGSLAVSKKGLAKKHVMTPSEKMKNGNSLAKGYGSTNPKRKPLEYRQAMYSESNYDIYDNYLLEKLLIGEPVTVPELRQILNKKVLNFEFIKLNGEVRPAKGTTMMKYIPKEEHPTGLNPSSDKVAAFYDLSKDAWRSVSNKSDEITLATDKITGKPKVVVSDKKPKEETKPETESTQIEKGKSYKYKTNKGVNTNIKVIDKISDNQYKVYSSEYNTVFVLAANRIGDELVPRPIVEPSKPIIKPTAVPKEIPETPSLSDFETIVDDEQEPLDITNSNVIADEITDDEIITNVKPKEEIEDIDQFPETESEIEFPEPEEEPDDDDDEDEIIDTL